jgi:hypothetical protein
MTAVRLIGFFLFGVMAGWVWNNFIRPVPSAEFPICQSNELCPTPEPDILSARKIFPDQCPIGKTRTVIKYRTITKNICEPPKPEQPAWPSGGQFR